MRKGNDAVADSEATSLESAERLCKALSAFGPELIWDEQDGYYVCVEFAGERDWRLFEVLNVMATHALGEIPSQVTKLPKRRSFAPSAAASHALARTNRTSGGLTPGRRRNDGLSARSAPSKSSAPRPWATRSFDAGEPCTA